MFQLFWQTFAWIKRRGSFSLVLGAVLTFFAFNEVVFFTWDIHRTFIMGFIFRSQRRCMNFRNTVSIKVFSVKLYCLSFFISYCLSSNLRSFSCISSLATLFFEFSLFFKYGILVSLVLRHEVIRIWYGCCKLNSCAPSLMIPYFKRCWHFQSAWPDFTHYGLQIIRRPFDIITCVRILNLNLLSICSSASSIDKRPRKMAASVK